MSGRCAFAACVLAWAAVWAAAPAWAQTVKIGVFDAQRVTQETAEGAKIQARLNGLRERKTGELKQLQDEIEKLQQEFVQTATTVSEEKRKELSLKIQRKQDELDGAQKAASREMQLEVEAAQEQWQRRVLKVVAAYASEQGYALVLPADVALFHAPALDITQELIKRIDAEAVAPAAKPATPPGP